MNAPFQPCGEEKLGYVSNSARGYFCVFSLDGNSMKQEVSLYTVLYTVQHL